MIGIVILLGITLDRLFFDGTITGFGRIENAPQIPHPCYLRPAFYGPPTTGPAP
jgi:hypothetical protein